MSRSRGGNSERTLDSEATISLLRPYKLSTAVGIHVVLNGLAWELGRGAGLTQSTAPPLGGILLNSLVARTKAEVLDLANVDEFLDGAGDVLDLHLRSTRR